MSLRGSRSLSTSGQISDESAAANALHNRLPDAEPPGWQWSARSSDALDAEACAKNLHKWQKFIEKVRTHSLALTHWLNLRVKLNAFACLQHDHSDETIHASKREVITARLCCILRHLFFPPSASLRSE